MRLFLQHSGKSCEDYYAEQGQQAFSGLRAIEYIYCRPFRCVISIATLQFCLSEVAIFKMK